MKNIKKRNFWVLFIGMCFICSLFFGLFVILNKEQNTACTAKISETIYNNILLLMKRNNYRILDYNHIPTKLFLTYCNLDIADFIEAASIETKINGNDNVA